MGRFAIDSLIMLLLVCGSEATHFSKPWRSSPQQLHRALVSFSSSSSTDVLDSELERRHGPKESSPLESNRIVKIRGGAFDDSDDEYDESDEEDDEDFFDGIDDADLSVEEDAAFYAGETQISRFFDAWSKTPPFTKTYLTASIIATAGGYFTGSKTSEFPEILTLGYKKLKDGQIWRPITAFLNLGPLGVQWPLTAHFVWTYMSTLERLNHNRPYDFWIMILVGCSSMLIGYPAMGVSPKYLGHNLSTFLVYVWSRYHEGLEVSVFELFTMKAEQLPWFFLAQTFLLEGELPLLDVLGIVFGHIYHYCKTVGMLRAPHFVVNWYETAKPGSFGHNLKQSYKQLSADFEVQEKDEDENQ